MFALFLVDFYSAIYSIRGKDRVFKLPKRPIFSFFTIQCIEIKHLFTKILVRCADILTFDSEWRVERTKRAILTDLQINLRRTFIDIF